MDYRGPLTLSRRSSTVIVLLPRLGWLVTTVLLQREEENTKKWSHVNKYSTNHKESTLLQTQQLNLDDVMTCCIYQVPFLTFKGAQVGGGVTYVAGNCPQQMTANRLSVAVSSRFKVNCSCY